MADKDTNERPIGRGNFFREAGLGEYRAKFNQAMRGHNIINIVDTFYEFQLAANQNRENSEYLSLKKKFNIQLVNYFNQLTSDDSECVVDAFKTVFDKLPGVALDSIYKHIVINYWNYAAGTDIVKGMDRIIINKTIECLKHHNIHLKDTITHMTETLDLESPCSHDFESAALEKYIAELNESFEGVRSKLESCKFNIQDLTFVDGDENLVELGRQIISNIDEMLNTVETMTEQLDQYQASQRDSSFYI